MIKIKLENKRAIRSDAAPPGVLGVTLRKGVSMSKSRLLKPMELSCILLILGASIEDLNTIELFGPQPSSRSNETLADSFKYIDHAAAGDRMHSSKDELSGGLPSLSWTFQ